MNKNRKASILIAEDERNTRDILQRFLRTDYDVTLAEDGERALNILKKNNFDLLLTDLRMPGADGIDILRAALKKNPPPACIVVTAYGSIENAVEAMKEGAFDFITKPLNFDRLEILLNRAVESKQLKEENRELRKRLDKNFGVENIIGKSSAMNDLLETVKQVAPSRSTVLITGESGTGKEVIAQSIHQLSARPGKFIPVHCAALPANLLESELFGHEKGAFTGASEQRKGRFELADGGTLFLDEIGEIDPSVQVKLLRALEARAFERVGGIETITTDTRLIAATNRNLRKMVAEGEFREDLYYRLDVVSIHLPPLRERQEDIPLFIKHFIVQFSQENSKEIHTISEAAIAALCAYDWPGNIRELRNCIERMVVLSRENTLEIENVPLNIREKSNPGIREKMFSSDTLEIDKNEKILIIKALEECGGNRTKAADKLGISRRTLHRKLKTFNIPA
ncbi:MAG: transcriptional regulator [Lentisphaerae bacterium GWF2_45_14]|nr:MAG: transcriptional regulator [Lentisphaerae bacterium GWF2_45_14]